MPRVNQKPKPPKKPHGRPSLFTPETCDYILEQVAIGRPLAEVCREEGMPDRTTVGKWRNENKEFDLRFARARDLGHEAILDQCMEIADESAQDFRKGKNGPEFNAEAVQRSKLRVWTRLELLARWDPKKYGPKQEVNLNANVSLGSAIVAGRRRSEPDKQ